MKRKLYILLLFFGISYTHAQETIFEKPSTIYRNEMAGGGILHTSGWGINFRYAEFLTAFSKLAYEIDVVGLKHPKEVKSFSIYEDNVKGYFYGKLNIVTLIRPSIGIHKIIIPKQSVSGVSVGTLFHLGPSLALVKPVYLNIMEETDGLKATQIVTKKYNPSEHTIDNIYGRASYFNGLDEMKLYPGIFAKYALQFDYANERDVLKALEAGISCDFYFKKLPIMAITENKQVYFNLYFNLLFGKRKAY